VGDADAALERRLRRMREEITDERLRLTAGLHLLAELRFARRTAVSRESRAALRLSGLPPCPRRVPADNKNRPRRAT
jgi:hypothetical protein